MSGPLVAIPPAQTAQYKVLAASMTAITAQTTLQNITGLGLAIGASSTEIWRVTWWLLLNAANATMDFKFGMTVPASTTAKGGAITGSNLVSAGWGAQGTAVAQSLFGIQTTVPAMSSAANADFGIPFVYMVFGGGTAGTVQPQYAQNTSDAGALQVLKGSMMEAVKVQS